MFLIGSFCTKTLTALSNQVLTSNEKQLIKDAGGVCKMDKLECTQYHDRKTHHHCSVCFKSFSRRGRMKDHMKQCDTNNVVKNPAPAGLSVIANKQEKICLVPPYKRGIQRPIHVQVSDSSLVCPETDCERISTIHERSRALPRFCRHVESGKMAKHSALPPFLLTESFLSTLSKDRGDSIRTLCNDGNPIVMYFGGGKEELDKSKQKIFYFSVGLHPTERRSYYSRLGRVITKFFVGNKITCECSQGSCCIHELITHEYLRQIATKMLTDTAPSVTISDPTVISVNEPAPVANSTPDNSNLKSQPEILYPPKEKGVLERMIEHSVKYKRIPLFHGTKPEARLKKLVPSERMCTHCHQTLSDPIFLKKGRALYKEGEESVDIYIKQCYNCKTPIDILILWMEFLTLMTTLLWNVPSLRLFLLVLLYLATLSPKPLRPLKWSLGL